MNEEAIAERLRQAVAPEPVAEIPTPQPEQNTNIGQATTAINIDLDEITQYKLHDFFGQTYKPNDEISRQQVQYIYQSVSKTLDDPQYGFVVARIRDLERIIGTANSDKRIYKLYQWLKLESIRKNIDAQMGAING